GLLFIFWARALRYNRRADFLIAGFILGAGMYFYQAVRMLPLIVIAGFVVALLVRARSWRAVRVYTLNTVALVIIALAVFVPLGRYMVEYPDSFWERTAGRIFGQDYVTDPETGIQTAFHPSLNDWIDTFRSKGDVFLDNMKQSLLMF